MDKCVWVNWQRAKHQTIYRSTPSMAGIAPLPRTTQPLAAQMHIQSQQSDAGIN